MADIVRKVAYFAMDVPNKPGEAAKVVGALADPKWQEISTRHYPERREDIQKSF
jgi:hypothetical protein